jgi:hypothetical protein
MNLHKLPAAPARPEQNDAPISTRVDILDSPLVPALIVGAMLATSLAPVLVALG